MQGHSLDRKSIGSEPNELQVLASTVRPFSDLYVYLGRT